MTRKHYELKERRFELQVYNDKELLIEKRSSKSCADYSRVVEVINGRISERPTIMPYINESGEDCYKTWVH